MNRPKYSLYNRWVFILLFCFLGVLSFGQWDELHVFDELDQAIGNRTQFEELKKEQIRKLRKELNQQTDSNDLSRFRIINQLHEAFYTYHFDSAMHYAFEMREAANSIQNKNLVAESKLKMSATFLASGIFIEARDTLQAIVFENLADSLKAKYYYVKARMYFDMADYYQKPYLGEDYSRKALRNLDTAITYALLESIEYYSYKGLQQLKIPDYKSAEETYAQLFEKFDLKGRQYAVDASTYAFVFSCLGQAEKELEWLIKAAKQDLQIANKENVALLLLATRLFEHGEIKKSSEYLDIALEDAKTYGAVQREFQISKTQPIVEAARTEIIVKQRNRIQLYALLATLLALLVVFVLFLLYRQLQKVETAKAVVEQSNNALKEINEKLREVNLIKEEYFTFFFKTNSELIDKLDGYRQEIDKKIKNHKIDDLRTLITKKRITTEREQLFHSFDTAFLKIFPDFIEKYNTLFEVEDRWTPSEKKKMNTDLRIFALIRLGISHTDKIAQILNYSVHTINTYKTKIKNLSIVPNDEFEKEILRIQSI